MISEALRAKIDLQESLVNTAYILEFASESIADGQLSNDATQGLYFILSGVKDSLKKIIEDLESLPVAEEPTLLESKRRQKVYKSQ
ncbi:hypothetical protein WDW89_02215 [Deltaproteobacteria bacterium TL4]